MVAVFMGGLLNMVLIAVRLFRGEKGRLGKMRSSSNVAQLTDRLLVLGMEGGQSLVVVVVVA